MELAPRAPMDPVVVLRRLVLASFVGSGACSVPTVPHLVGSFVLADVTGRIDHLAFDPATRRLFVACVGHGSVEVIDVANARRVGAVSGLQEPQGIAVVPRGEPGARVFVACGGDGAVHVFDAATLCEIGRVDVGEDADNVRLDPRAGRVLVGCGTDDGGAIVAIDPERLVVVHRTPIDGHPEGFQIDPSSPRMFVNVPGGKLARTDGTVFVADRDSGTTTGIWPLQRSARNFPLAYVPERRVVLVACREPAQLIARDGETGETLAIARCCADADDVFFDAATDRVFVIGGGDVGGADRGGLDVFHLGARGELQRIATVALPTGARTALFVPERRSLFVAAPGTSGAPARILEFTVD